MNYNTIIKDLHERKYASIYFLMGEEGYFIDQIESYLSRNALEESEKDFNQHIFYGEDVQIDQIVTAAKRFPMMASHQLVVVREAQNLEKVEELLPYVEQYMPSTILVVCYKYKTLDKRTSFYKKLAKVGVVFESKGKRDYEMPDWVVTYLKNKGIKISIREASLLVEYLGTNLSKMANELDKLTISLPKGANITIEYIEKNIGISKDYNIFELQNAIGKRDILKCNRIINYYAANINANPIPRTISSLFGYFNKLLKIHLCNANATTMGIHPFIYDKDYLPACKIYTPRKLVENIAILREFDMKSKGKGNVSASAADLQKEMIYKLLH